MSPIAYLKKAFDPTDPTVSLKHIAYGGVIAFGCFWLSYDLAIKGVGGVKHGIDAEWVAAFGLLLTAVTTGKIVGSGPSPAPTVGASASPAPGAVVPETTPIGSDKS